MLNVKSKGEGFDLNCRIRNLEKEREITNPTNWIRLHSNAGAFAEGMKEIEELQWYREKALCSPPVGRITHNLKKKYSRLIEHTSSIDDDAQWQSQWSKRIYELPIDT